MSGLLNGPFCQIAGAALETVCDHVPLGKVGFKALKAVKKGVINSQKLSEEEKIRIKYETIGAHIEGACKILRPAMELKNILVPQSKSADRAKSAENSSASLHYFTPQKPGTQCRCAEEICRKDLLPKRTQCDQQKGFAEKSVKPEKENLKYSKDDGLVKKERKLSYESGSDSDLDLKSKNNDSWKKCDACEAVSKILIRTTCDHAICQKCVKSGTDCQKCLNSDKKFNGEPKKKLYPQLFDTD